ncbi:MAG: DnaA regulatory inactivator Hda, partial [Gammaproteobacteria bacterium]
MTHRLAQLTLSLFATPRLDFADFHGATNQVVSHALAQWAEQRTHWCIGLWGGAGVGKSHLLQAAIRHAHQRGLVSMYVPLKEVLRFNPSMLENLERIDAIAIDDLDLAAGDKGWETALFALYNRCVAAGTQLLYSANNPPQHLPIALADLRSRLAAALIYQLVQSDDREKQEILAALARSRGIDLGEPVCAFLLRRLPRTLPALVAALEQLDAASLRA